MKEVAHLKRILSGVLRLTLKLAVQFSFGGGLYFLMETVFRHIRSHTSPSYPVFFLGGGAFVLGILLCRIPLSRRWLALVLPPLGFGVLTAYEYLFGLYFLTTRGLRIWNYTGCPHEYRGLICLQFSLCWGALMWLILAIDTLTEHLLRHTRFAFSALFSESE